MKQYLIEIWSFNKDLTEGTLESSLTFNSIERAKSYYIDEYLLFQEGGLDIEGDPIEDEREEIKKSGKIPVTRFRAETSSPVGWIHDEEETIKYKDAMVIELENRIQRADNLLSMPVGQALAILRNVNHNH